MTTTDTPEVEIWQNTRRSSYAVVRLDEKGNERRQMVRGGDRLTIKTSERKLNQEQIVRTKDDPFNNGTFVLIDGPEGVSGLKDNPNQITQSEVEKLFEAAERTMKSKLRRIDSPITLKRILETGQQLGAATSRLNLVRARLVEVDGGAPVDSSPDEDEPVQSGPGGNIPPPQQVDFYQDGPQQPTGVQQFSGSVGPVTG